MKRNSFLIVLLSGILAGSLIYVFGDYSKSSFDNKLSLIANVAEIVGLVIVYVQVMHVASETEILRWKLNSLQHLSSSIQIQSNLEICKLELSRPKIGGAAIPRLEITLNLFRDMIPDHEITNKRHPRRRLVDDLNNAINYLHQTKKLQPEKLEGILVVLSDISREADSIKRESKTILT